MRAFTIETYAGTPALAERPLPEPGPGQIRVRIAACGLNFADLLMIEGSYQERPDPPVTLGMEPAAWSMRSAPASRGRCRGPGSRSLPAAAGWRTTAVSRPQAACRSPTRCPSPMPPPSRSPMAPPMWRSATGRAAAGETLLVLGAAGGVGLAAVEIGKLMGARVIACARGADRLGAAGAAGADHLIDSAGADLRAEVRALGGADVVFDPVGGEQFEAAFRATNPGGRLIPIGFASGTVPQIPANHLLVKNLTVIGLYWGGYLRLRPEVLTDSLATLLGWYGEGRLRPHVSHQLPLDRAGEALALLRGRQATGKVVVTL